MCIGLTYEVTGIVVRITVLVDDRAVGLIVDEGLDLTEVCVGVLLTGAAGIEKALEAAVGVVGVREGKSVVLDADQPADAVVDTQGDVPVRVGGALGGNGFG